MEAEKSHNLLSANWRPRKAKDVIHSKSEGLRIGDQWHESLSEAKGLTTRSTEVQGQKIDVLA